MIQDQLDMVLDRPIDEWGRAVIETECPPEPPSWRWVRDSLMKYGRTVESLAVEIDEPLPRLLAVLTDIVEDQWQLTRRIRQAVVDWPAAVAREELEAQARAVGLEREPEQDTPQLPAWYVHLWTKGDSGRRKRTGLVHDPREVDFYGAPGCVDEYCTVWGYPPEFESHVQSTGSVAGYQGPIKAFGLHIDLDGDGNGDRVLEDARRILDNPEYWSISRVYFSGNKGLSIHLYTADEGASCDMHRRIGSICAAIARAKGVSTLDSSVYDATRLWRIPNSINGKSGLYKIPVLSVELIGKNALTWGQIRERALRQRSLTEAFCEFIARGANEPSRP